MNSDAPVEAGPTPHSYDKTFILVVKTVLGRMIVMFQPTRARDAFSGDSTSNLQPWSWQFPIPVVRYPTHHYYETISGCHFIFYAKTDELGR